MSTRYVVLGAGMIGSAIARDLAADPACEVHVADVQGERLASLRSKANVKTTEATLAEPGVVRRVVAGADVVVGALPSLMGYAALAEVIEAGCHHVDVSFMTEDPSALDEAARQKGVTVLFDCGVAPGLTHMLAGCAAARLAPCERIEIYVGGLPEDRRWPFEYKAGFAPYDVIEEYTRPVQIVENGRVVVREALSELEPFDAPGLGTLEAFNTDGLRSLVRSLKVPFMKEKTLRYPGHVELMRIFRETGLFSKDSVVVGSQSVRPLDVTAALLFPRWTFGPGEADLTVMSVRAYGQKQGQPPELRWDLLDRYDPATGLRSMSRTTGFTAAAVARLVGSGAYRHPGVSAPEAVGAQPDLLQAVLADLGARGVNVVGSGQV
jgi:lysine 6-dehydrogenase